MIDNQFFFCYPGSLSPFWFFLCICAFEIAYSPVTIIMVERNSAAVVKSKGVANFSSHPNIKVYFTSCMHCNNIHWDARLVHIKY